MPLAQQAGNGNPVDLAAKVEIDQGGVGLLGLGELQRLAGRERRSDHLVARSFQRHLERERHEHLVLHDQDHHAPRPTWLPLITLNNLWKHKLQGRSRIDRENAAQIRRAACRRPPDQRGHARISGRRRGT